MPEILGISEYSVTDFLQGCLDGAFERGIVSAHLCAMDEEVEAYWLKGPENARWNTTKQAREAL